MKRSWPVIIARILLGLIFTVLPLLTIIHAMPNQTVPQPAVAFLGGLMGSGYELPLVWGTEILAGLLLLFGFSVPFALILLAPVIVNIFLFHFFLAPSGLPLAIVICILEIFLGWSYRDRFAPLFGRAAA